MGLSFEMLHGVRHIGRASVDSRLLQRLSQNPPRRPDKWVAAQILLISWLLSDQYEPRMPWPFAEDNLRRIPVERTSRALLRGALQHDRAVSLRNPRGMGLRGICRRVFQ